MSCFFSCSVHRGARERDAEWSKAAGTSNRSRGLSHPQAQKPN